MRIALKDRQFDVTAATLTAAIPDPYWSAKYNPTGSTRLTWHLEFAAAPAPGNDMWDVRVYKNNLNFPIRDWKDVAGRTVEWTEYVDEFGERNGSFYLLQHVDIPRARLRFLERDGIRFRIEWDGICAVYWSEEYESDLPFSLTGWATFSGVRVLGSETDTEHSLCQRLAQHLDVSGFQQGPVCRDGQYNSGVGMAHAVFTPIE